MNIIFGADQLKQMQEKYIVLELDTFVFPDNNTHTAYCVVESIPVTELDNMKSMVDLHTQLMSDYREREWAKCSQALSLLKGFWSGELDSFYDIVKQRVEQYSERDPGEDWTPFIHKK